jgi:hypothetical protein
VSRGQKLHERGHVPDPRDLAKAVEASDMLSLGEVFASVFQDDDANSFVETREVPLVERFNAGGSLASSSGGDVDAAVAWVRAEVNSDDLRHLCAAPWLLQELLQRHPLASPSVQAPLVVVLKDLLKRDKEGQPALRDDVEWTALGNDIKGRGLEAARNARRCQEPPTPDSTDVAIYNPELAATLPPEATAAAAAAAAPPPSVERAVLGCMIKAGMQSWDEKSNEQTPRCKTLPRLAGVHGRRHDASRVGGRGRGARLAGDVRREGLPRRVPRVA